MKTRLILASLIVALFGIAISSQIKSVSAEVSSNPITGPITKPITYFTYKISGTAIYKVNTKILRVYSRKIKYIDFPAKGVVIEAINTKTMKKQYAVTDEYGKYTLDVEPGIYKVIPSDSKGTRFLPSYYWQPINKDTNMPFSGYPKTWPL